MPTLNEKREELGTAWASYKAFRDSLPEDDKAWSAEQRATFDKYNTDLDSLENEIDAIQKREIQEAKDAEREAKYTQSQKDKRDGHKPDADKGDKPDTDEHRSTLFTRALSGGLSALNDEEQRAMVAGDDKGGGYLISPVKFVTGLLQEVDSAIGFRQKATIHQLTKAASLGVVKLDDDVDDFDWTSELKTGTEDAGLAYGKRALAAYPVGKRVKISRTLIRLSGRDVQGLLMNRIKIKLGQTMEKAYLTGDGQNKPLGVFVPSSDGIPTARDVSEDMAATNFTSDGLISVQESLKSAYKGSWLFHPDAIKKIRKLKDSDGQYLWQPGLKEGTPSAILGDGYTKSDFCPNTFTSGQYVGMYGDFSYYWIVDALNMAIQVLFELYAEQNQVGYICRYEGDGQPVMAEAFSRIKLG